MYFVWPSLVFFFPKYGFVAFSSNRWLVDRPLVREANRGSARVARVAVESRVSQLKRRKMTKRRKGKRRSGRERRPVAMMRTR